MVAAALERMNHERLELLNSPCMKDGIRLHRLKNEVKGMQIGAVWNHLLVRCFQKKIHTKGAERNLGSVQEKELARCGRPGIRVVVYTCITGNYDMPKEPFYAFRHCDYILFSKQQAHGWDRRDIPEGLSRYRQPAWINRYLKFHPFELFAGSYDYSIYLDGNITPVSDLSVFTELVDPQAGLAFHRHCSRLSLTEEYTACKNMKKGSPRHLRRQVNAYRKEGMPDDYGLAEGNVIVTALGNKTAKKLMRMCWHEFVKYKGGRDQIVWPYVFWKAGIPMGQVCTLGNNVWRNPKLFITAHTDR